MLKELAESKGMGSVGISEKITEALKQAAFAFFGFLMSSTTLYGNMSPLGAALSAGVPLKNMFVAAIGSVIGCLLSGKRISSMRYIAALLAVVTIRILLNSIKHIGKSALWAGITAFAAVTSVGIASVGGADVKAVATALVEGLLAGGSAYFIRIASDVRRYGTVNTPEQATSLLISVNLMLLALYPIAFDGISVGRIAATLLIIISARFGRVGTAAICGASVSAAYCLSGEALEYAAVYCIIGLLCGVLSGLGKAATAAAPVLLGLSVAIVFGEVDELRLLIECAAASTASLLIPRTLTSAVAGYISPPTSTPDSKGLRRTLTMRLSLASAALHGVTETVEDVARCLAISEKPSFAGVLHEVENDVCKGCSFHSYCWEKQRKTTVDAVLGMSDAIRHCRPIELADVPDGFTEKCLRLEKFEDSLYRRYSDFLSNIEAEKRVGEMRSVVSEHMDGIADMLDELSEEFRTAQKYDTTLAGRLAAALKEIDIRADECACVIDKFGRLTIEIRLRETPEMPINRAKMLSVLENVCERDFEPPEVTKNGRTYYITATEKSLYSVDCACTQFNQGNNRHCGDTCRYFFDGRGRLVVIVSDGMGSGGRAAVDSAMTSGLAERLIKAGFGYDCTLKLVNSAMLFKSTDESLATLDISCVDLHTGKTELFKAGAAPTIVRRNGRTGRAECRSLPAGILSEVGFDKATVTLREDDILLMMSDGVCTDGTDWICAEVETFGSGGAKQLSERIASGARRRRRDGHDDDITVFAAIIEKAV